MNLRKDSLAICKAALRAADPEEALLRHVQCADGVLLAGGGKYRLDKIRNVYVVGAGKACAPMAKQDVAATFSDPGRWWDYS